MKALLHTTKASDPEMVPALAIGLFAGLRRSEFFALDWSEVDLENLTASEMGNSPGMVVRHYPAVVTGADAAEYWRISPTNVG